MIGVSNGLLNLYTSLASAVGRRQSLPYNWTEIFPLPDCLEDQRFRRWVRRLDRESQVRLLDEIAEWELQRQGLDDGIRELIRTSPIEQELLFSLDEDEWESLGPMPDSRVPRALREAMRIAERRRFPTLPLLVLLAASLFAATALSIGVMAMSDSGNRAAGGEVTADVDVPPQQGVATNTAGLPDVGHIQKPPYSVHTVEAGDAVGHIAAKFRVSVEAILWSNPGLWDDPSVLSIGDKLLIPLQDGVIYKIEGGDSVDSIAAEFGSAVEEIAAVNGLADPSIVQPGQLVLVPCDLLSPFSKEAAEVGQHKSCSSEVVAAEMSVGE